MARVRKAVFQVTFLYDVDCTPDAEVRGMHVDEILTEMDSGHFIGKVGPLMVSDGFCANVEAELLELGNDGTFFDEEPDDA
jgi:hypothetical protein